MDKIEPSKIWENLTDRVLIDVRSPAEFAHAHEPNAHSMPLFNDEERAKVGTLYKQVSPENALLKGLDFVGPKMSSFIKQAIKWSPNRKILLYCWRGGKRSGSVAWLLKFAGFDVMTIQGGYKAYRQFILQQFENQRLNIIILGGKTGSGKTFILQELEKQGEQIIDLEALAHHKGSAFGWIGEQNQSKGEQFENDLYEVFRKIDPSRRVWVENESRSVGSVFIPQAFWNQMKNAPLVHIELPFEQRVQHLVSVYTSTSKEDLIASFEKITKKLGFNHAKNAIEYIQNGDYATATKIALVYYDKTYDYCFNNNTAPSKNILQLKSYDYANSAQQLIQFANTHFSKNTHSVLNQF